MDYEKKYKEALEIAQKLYQDCPNGKNDRLYHTTDLEKMFPELRESEDEKIRKELIEHIKDQQSSFISAPDCRDKYEEEENNKYNSWLAWLEKQSEQKPTLPKWKYKKDNTTLLKDSLVLNKCGHMAKLSSGAIVSDVWVIDYDELAKLPKEELEEQGEQKLAEWSEEDETGLTNTIIMLKEGASLHFNKKDITKAVNWIKSLKQKIKEE